MLFSADLVAVFGYCAVAAVVVAVDDGGDDGDNGEDYSPLLTVAVVKI